MLVASEIRKNNTYERLIRAKNGSLLRVIFEVYEIDGTLKGRVISVQPVLELHGHVSSTTLCLCSATKGDAAIVEIVSPFQFTVSPYPELYFFTSQPTRAPNFHN